MECCRYIKKSHVNHHSIVENRMRTLGILKRTFGMLKACIYQGSSGIGFLRNVGD